MSNTEINPVNPALGDEITRGGTRKKWDGAKWINVSFGNHEKRIEANEKNIEEFDGYLKLKIFQSPTNGLTEIKTRTLLGGEVYEVRKVSDGSLATIYTDKEGLNPIVQNGTSNVSGSDGTIEFYIADGDYYIVSKDESNNFRVGMEAVNVIFEDGKTLEEFREDLPEEVDAAGTAAALISIHNSDPTAHPELSALVTSEADRAEAAADAVLANQPTGVIVFTTYSLLDAYTPSDADEQRASYKVTNDPDSSLNGYYHWVSGTAYEKDADLVVNTIDENNTSDAVSGKAVAGFSYSAFNQSNEDRVRVLSDAGYINEGRALLYTESGTPKAQSTTYAGYAVALTASSIGEFDVVDLHIQLDTPAACIVYALDSALNVLTSIQIDAVDGWNSATLQRLISPETDGGTIYIGIETINRDPMTINTITPPAEYASTGTYPVKATPFANDLGDFTTTVSSQFRIPVRLFNSHNLHVERQGDIGFQAGRVAPILAESLTTAMSSSRGGELESTFTNFTSTYAATATAYNTPDDPFDSMRVYFISETDSAFRFYLKNDELGDIEFVETEVLPAGPQSVVIALSKFYTSTELGSQFYVAIESINHVSRVATRNFIDDESEFPQPANAYPVKFIAAADDDNSNWIGGGSSITYRLYVEFYDLSSVANALSVAVANAESTASVKMAIPSNFYSIDGLNNQSIYYSNITKAASADDYLFDISAGLTGRMKAKSFQNRKTGAGTQTITAKLYNRNRVLLDEVSSTLNQVSSSAGTGKTPTALCIGDSITARGFYTQDLLDLAGADVMGLNLIGTRGTAPNNHEGEGGKTVDWFYTNAASPFVFGGVFDFAQYMSTNGYSTLDYIFIHLGVNDIFFAENDSSALSITDAASVQIEDMIAQFKSFNASIKIGLMLPITSSFDQDAWGIVYSDAATYWRYNSSRNVWCNGIIDSFDNRTGENIFVLPTNCTIDIEAGYNVADPIHPIDNGSGYEDMANTVWAFLKNKEA